MLDIIKAVRDTLGLPQWLFVVTITVIAAGAISQAVKHLGPPAIRGGRKLRSLLRRTPAWTADEKRRAERRALFAHNQIARLLLLDDAEDWSDHQFTDLELEVESEVVLTRGIRRLWFAPSASRRRRETSLTAALESFGIERRNYLRDAKLVAFLQGDPGSGKSVALRTVARELADRAHKKLGAAVVPLYINLKNLESDGDNVDANLIRAFVLQTLRARGTSSIDRFLNDEFDYALEHGHWLFLFDSFDEIPAVLSSTEYDKTVRTYADAIHGFLALSVNACNAVVASRYFRAPPGYGWPTLTIAKLTAPRQLELIRKADIDERDRELLTRHLPDADAGVAFLAANPMFLGLLCAFVGERHALPASSHEVFEQSISSRLNRDEANLLSRGMTSTRVRFAAEELAFAMTGSDLEPSRNALLRRREELGFPVDPQLHRIMDALEYLQLAHRPTVASSDEERTFTFAHRRFQEYFATSLIVRRPERLDVDSLLLDYRWRETAVTLCQTHPELARPMIIRAAEMLDGWSPLREDHAEDDLVDHVAGTRATTSFEWPEKSHHVLALLQSGFPSGDREVPDSIRVPAARLVRAAFTSGRVHIQRWAIDIAGVATEGTLVATLRAAFASNSAWLRDGAYQQVARIGVLPEDMCAAIRRVLLSRVSTGTLRRDRASEEAQLRRLADPTEFLAAIKQLQLAERMNLASHAVYAVLVIVLLYTDPLFLCIYLVLIGTSYWSFYDLAANASRRRIANETFTNRGFTAELRRSKQAIGLFWQNAKTWRAQRTSLRPPASVSPTRVRVFLRIVIRLVALLFVLPVVLVWCVEYPPFSAVAILVPAGLIWSHGVLVAVSRGEYVGGAAQLLAPLSFLRAFVDVLRASFWLSIFTGTVSLIGAIGVTILLNLCATWLSPIVTVSLLGLVLVAWIFEGVNHLIRYGHDLVLFIRWQSHRGDFMSTDEFVARLARQRTGIGMLRVVSTARQNNLLDNVGDLTDLVLDLEEMATSESLLRRERDTALSGAGCRVKALNLWFEPSARRSLKALREAGPDLADELAQLIEGASKKRKHRVAAPGDRLVASESGAGGVPSTASTNETIT